MKNFGFGILCGAVLGAVIGFVKNPNTGNTIKHDFKQTIDETIADGQQIKTANASLQENKNYLLTEGQETINDFTADLKDRIDGFQNQIQPNLKRIDERIASLNEHLNNFSASEDEEN